MPEGMETTPHGTGRTAERIAEQFYLEQGFSVVTRNYRCPRGEIDLLLFGGGELLMVEVKGRRVLRMGDVWRRSWHRKLGRMHFTLRWFLREFPAWDERAEGLRAEIVFVVEGKVSARFGEEAIGPG